MTRGAEHQRKVKGMVKDPKERIYIKSPFLDAVMHHQVVKDSKSQKPIIPLITKFPLH